MYALGTAQHRFYSPTHRCITQHESPNSKIPSEVYRHGRIEEVAHQARRQQVHQSQNHQVHQESRSSRRQDGHRHAHGQGNAGQARTPHRLLRQIPLPGSCGFATARPMRALHNQTIYLALQTGGPQRPPISISATRHARATHPPPPPQHATPHFSSHQTPSPHPPSPAPVSDSPPAARSAHNKTSAAQSPCTPGARSTPQPASPPHHPAASPACAQLRTHPAAPPPPHLPSESDSSLPPE